MPTDPLSATLISVALLMSLTLAWRHLPNDAFRRKRPNEKLDTVVGWQPEPARVMNVAEVAALELARRAAPEALLLAQVPLSRFLRVSTRNSYGRWLERVGSMNADLLVCDARTRVLAVIDIRSPHASERNLRRHGRMQRVLKAAGIPVLIWQEDKLPSLGAVRAQLSALGAAVDRIGSMQVQNTSPSPLTAMGSRDLAALLAEGDAAAEHRSARALAEAVPSEFHGMHSQPSTIH